MADRTTKVTLVAQVNGYLAGMKQAQSATAKTATEAQKLANKKQAIQDLGVAATAMGAVAAAGLGIAIKKFMDFDAEMAQVQALSHATGAEMGKLRDTALTVGQQFGYSATQVAQAETELIKAGISLKDIMGGALTGALTLAADGQMDVADATQIAGEAMTQFKLKGKDVPHIADLLAAGADKALGSVGDLGQALESGGLVAAQFGLSLDDTVGVLAAFAQAGIVGERGGTDLRQMLLKLAAPAEESQKWLDKLGITLYDSKGAFVGITNLSGQLKDKMKDLDPATRNAAMATIFGARAIQGANVLYAEGAKGIQGWIDKVNDQGFAAEQARKKLDSLQGDLTKLGAALDTTLIKTGGTANGVLRELVQGATGFTKAIGDVPTPVANVVVGVTALVAGVGLLGGGFLLLVPRIAATRAAMAELNITGGRVAKVFGKGGAIMLGLSAITGALAATGSEGTLTASQLANIDAAFKTDNLKKFNKEFVGINGGINNFKGAVKDLASGNFWESYYGGAAQFDGALKSVTFGLVDLGAGMETNKAKFSEMGRQLATVAKQDMPSATKAFNQFVKMAGGGKEAVRRLLVLFPDYKASLIDLAASQHINLSEQDLMNVAQGKGAIAAKLAAAATKTSAEAYTDQANSTQDAVNKLNDLIEAMNAANKSQQDSVSSNASYRDAVADAADKIDKAKRGVEGYSTSMDQTTKAGADNAAMFADIASKSQAAAKAQFDVDGNTQTYLATLAAGKAALVGQITDLTGNATAAQQFADNVYHIPTVREAQIIADTKDATDKVNAFKTLMADLKNPVTVQIRASLGNVASALQGFLKAGKGKAAGGILPGAPSRVDNMLVPMASGEFVTRAAQAAIPANRRVLDYINNGGVMRGYASGGVVSPYSTSSRPSVNVSAPAVTINSPVYTSGGDLVGIIQGVAGQQLELRFQQEAMSAARGSRGRL